MSEAAGALRDALCGLLGQTLPAPPAEAAVQGEAPQEFGGVPAVRTELRLGAAPATWLRPAGGAAPAPAVLYCHAHGGDFERGRRELTEGSRFLAGRWAGDLLAAGWSVLCLDMPGFGDRQGEGSESALAKAGTWRGQPLFGRMLAELSAAVGWLAAQPQVDPQRIATLGLSMGAAHAFWLGALDGRIAAVAQMCMLADIGPLIATGGHDRHGHYLTVPGLLRLGDMGDVAALVAPRPQFVSHGAEDALAPPAAREPALARLRAAYEGAPEGNLTTFLSADSGHIETPAMRRAALAFLTRTLAADHTQTETRALQ